MSPRRLIIVLALATSAAACGSDSSPASPSPPTPPAGQTIPVTMWLTSDHGPYSVTFQGKTYTSDGFWTIDLAPGTYYLTGTMRTNVVGVGFGRLSSLGNPGGVVSGSVLPGGPVLSATQCQASFLTLSPPAVFTVTFTVSSVSSTACQAPA